MFAWFAPRCPVDFQAKTWVEGRLRWLGEQFGDTRFLEREPVLPTQAHFPELFDARGCTLQALFERVCGWMDVDPARVELEVLSEKVELGLVNQDGHAVGGAAGYYRSDEGRERLQVCASQISQPLHLIGTLAHELSHLKLLGDDRLSGRELDNELVTDLCVVHHGLGIFLANGPRAWLADFTRWPGTGLKKPEYMTAAMYGWALAHQAWLRDETRPRWFTLLRGDSRTCARDGLRYLSRSRDSAFATRQWTAWEHLQARLEPRERWR